jgi:multisite-specific tRNA:(cytosine-C5)-methyltransferase
MLPKEERRALLLRLFDDDTPLINNSVAWNNKTRQDVDTPPPETADGVDDAGMDDVGVVDDDEAGLPSKEEEEVIKKENLVLGQEEQDAMNERETFVKNGDELDVMNKTV